MKLLPVYSKDKEMADKWFRGVAREYYSSQWYERHKNNYLLVILSFEAALSELFAASLNR